MAVHFGLALDFNTQQRSLDQHLDRHTELVRLAERYGFDSVWAGESYPMEPGAFHLPAPFLVLAALAPRTRMQIGTGVILLPAHQPLRLAYETAVLDQLSGGRLILGAGVGQPRLARRFGVTAPALGDYVDDMLGALRSLWRGEDGYRGRYLTVEGRIAPLPLQAGGPPIWVGGAIRRSAERAAELGDGYYASTTHTYDQLVRQIGRYREALAARGKDPAASVISANRLTAVAETEAEARQVGRGGLGMVLERYARNGSLGEALKAAALPAEQIFDDLAEALCLAGTPDQVAAGTQRYVDAGVTHFQFRLAPEHLPAEAAARSVELLGEQVLPRFA